MLCNFVLGLIACLNITEWKILHTIEVIVVQFAQYYYNYYCCRRGGMQQVK